MVDDQIKKSAECVWQEIKAYLLPYAGAASQIYVIDLPTAELRRVVGHLRQTSSNCVVSARNGIFLDQSIPLAEDSDGISDITRSTDLSVLKCDFSGRKQLQFYFWPNARATSFDIEIVFFADDFFNEQDAEPMHFSAFRWLYDLVEVIRLNSANSDCVFSDNEAADPRNDRDRNVVW